MGTAKLLGPARARSSATAGLSLASSRDSLMTSRASEDGRKCVASRSTPFPDAVAQILELALQIQEVAVSHRFQREQRVAPCNDAR
jgi:hypothetical protein